ncbi:MAG: hypothetical protein HZC17_09385, partial [Candidatus Omnitrophica bacterium]|nr:hypothetical protein [Candidatus Omnitrophota bacterium]
DNIHGAPRKDVLAPGTRENPLKRKSSASGMRNLIDGRGKVGGDQIQRTDNILGTPRKSAPSRRFFGKSLGEESLNAEGRSLGDVIGTIRELAGRVVGRELPSVRDFLYNLVFGEELIARASEDKSLQDFRAEHAEYVKNLPDALYSKAHQEQPELGVLATTSDLYSPEIERQLLVNSKALAVIVFTGAMRDLNAFKKRFARVSDRIIIEPASKPEAGSVMNQILSGSALRKLAGNVKQTVLARHTAVFASSEILSELTALKLSSRLVASDKEGLIQKQLTSFGISESDFRLYGNAVGFLIAKNGGYDALDDEAREGLTRPDGDNWIRFNLSLLGAKIAQLVNEFAGFQAVQQAA